MSLVYELTLMIEGAAIVGDSDATTFSKHEVLLTIDLESNVQLTSIEECDLREVVQLIVQNSVLLFMPRL